MKSVLWLLALWIVLSCQKSIDRTDQLYGKWLLAGGSALAKRQTSVNPKPIYFTFLSTGGIDSNWSTCYSFRFGKADEMLTSNNCVDCAVPGCGDSVWHYTFNNPYEMTIEFQAGDVGLFRRQ